MSSVYAGATPTKRCHVCGKQKPVSEFYRNNRARRRPSDDGYQSDCKACRKGRKNGSRPETLLLHKARYRARADGLPINITIEDIVIPNLCPILGIRLEKSVGGAPSAASPSLDRIIPFLGYVRGNIQVVSFKANAMKNDASPEELLRFAEWVVGAFSARKE